MSRNWFREKAQPDCSDTNVPTYSRFIVSSKPANAMIQPALIVMIVAKRVKSSTLLEFTPT